ncbi:MAG: STAS domain-containing protein [Spirochaetales bacterium]|jgi:anti-anti-sigma regulatory factor|nr:STAS domain-containing protein [Exilispira sp.]NMC67154.1 STAS domain-containing protein [Spirochaetales bacterium]
MEKEIIIIFPKIDFDQLLKEENSDSKNKVQDFFDQISECINKKINSISIDCSYLVSINSSILAKFLYFQKRYKKFGIKFRFFNLSSNIKRILLSLGFNDFFIID